MKRILCLILCLATVFSMTTVCMAETEKVTVTLDGNEITFPDAQPFIDSRARTLVPIRFVSEAMGAEVLWDNNTQTVTILKDKDTINYTINEFKAYLNGQLMSFDSCGILKEDRTFVPLRFISELLACKVDWVEDTKTVVITSPSEVVAFPEPELTVHYPESESDRRLFWITIDNYRDYERHCPNYEFKIEFEDPEEFNEFEQDEGAINGWQKYSRSQFVKLTLTGNTVYSVSRAFYSTRDNKKTFKPKDGQEMHFKLTVLRKCSGEIREYEFTENLKLPYPLIKVEG